MGTLEQSGAIKCPKCGEYWNFITLSKGVPLCPNCDEDLIGNANRRLKYA